MEKQRKLSKESQKSYRILLQMGGTLLCCGRNHCACGTEETFVQDFVEILKEIFTL